MKLFHLTHSKEYFSSEFEPKGLPPDNYSYIQIFYNIKEEGEDKDWEIEKIVSQYCPGKDFGEPTPQVKELVIDNISKDSFSSLGTKEKEIPYKFALEKDGVTTDRDKKVFLMFACASLVYMNYMFPNTSFTSFDILNENIFERVRKFLPVTDLEESWKEQILFFSSLCSFPSSVSKEQKEDTLPFPFTETQEKEEKEKGKAVDNTSDTFTSFSIDDTMKETVEVTNSSIMSEEFSKIQKILSEDERVSVSGSSVSEKKKEEKEKEKKKDKEKGKETEKDQKVCNSRHCKHKHSSHKSSISSNATAANKKRSSKEKDKDKDKERKKEKRSSSKPSIKTEKEETKEPQTKVEENKKLGELENKLKELEERIPDEINRIVDEKLEGMIKDKIEKLVLVANETLMSNLDKEVMQIGLDLKEFKRRLLQDISTTYLSKAK